MPAHFGVKSEIDRDSQRASIDAESSQKQHTQQPFSYNQLETTRHLINQGGSSAYLMLKYNIENLQRQELGNYNESIVKHNKQELIGAQSHIQN